VRGSSQLKHLLIDLGMKQEAVDDIRSGEPGDFAVVSLVTARTGEAVAADPLGLGTRIEPRWLVRYRDRAAEATPLAPAGFHPGFSRIRF
jgi:hypothetical protein